MLFLVTIIFLALYLWRADGSNHLIVPIAFSFLLARRSKIDALSPEYAQLLKDIRRSGKACDETALSLHGVLSSLDLQRRDVKGIQAGFMSKILGLLALAFFGRMVCWLYYEEGRFLTYMSTEDLALQLVVVWFCVLACCGVTCLLFQPKYEKINSPEDLYDFSRAFLLDVMPRTEVVQNCFCETWYAQFRDELIKGVSLRKMRMSCSRNSVAHFIQNQKDLVRIVEAWLPCIDVFIGAMVITTFLLNIASTVT